MRIIKDTNIQFMSQYKLGAFLSGAVIILGIIYHEYKVNQT